MYNGEMHQMARDMRPDVVLTRPAGTCVRCEIRPDGRADSDDTAKFDDICKMHTYHDYSCRALRGVPATVGHVRLRLGAWSRRQWPWTALGCLRARPGKGSRSVRVCSVRQLLAWGRRRRLVIAGPARSAIRPELGPARNGLTPSYPLWGI